MPLKTPQLPLKLGKLGDFFPVSQVSQGTRPVSQGRIPPNRVPKYSGFRDVFPGIPRSTLFLPRSRSLFLFAFKLIELFQASRYYRCGHSGIGCRVLKPPKLAILSQGSYGMYHSFPRCSRCRAKFPQGSTGFPSKVPWEKVKILRIPFGFQKHDAAGNFRWEGRREQ